MNKNDNSIKEKLYNEAITLYGAHRVITQLANYQNPNNAMRSKIERAKEILKDSEIKIHALGGTVTVGYDVFNQSGPIIKDADGIKISYDIGIMWSERFLSY